MKIVYAASVLAVLSGCDMLKKAGGTAAEGGADTSDSSTTTTAAATTPTSLAQKALSFLSAGTPFEGEIVMTMTDAKPPPKTITYMVKGTKMRFDSPSDRPGGGGYVIFDTVAKKMTTINDAQKMAMVIDMNQTNAGGPSAGGPLTKSTVDRTSKTDTVAGYSCEIWSVTETNGDKSEICVAKGIAFPQLQHSAGWMSELADAFPLRAVTSDPSGKEKTRMEVTKIDKKSLDDAVFQVPPGYKTMSMDDMMKMGGRRPGMGGPPPR